MPRQNIGQKKLRKKKKKNTQVIYLGWIVLYSLSSAPSPVVGARPRATAFSSVMGCYIHVFMERKVTRVDAATRLARIQLLLCGNECSCPLPFALMSSIARLLAGNPIGGDAWALCESQETILISQQKWGQLYEEDLRRTASALVAPYKWSAPVRTRCEALAALSHRNYPLFGLLSSSSVSAINRGSAAAARQQRRMLEHDAPGRRRLSFDTPQLSCMVGGLPPDMSWQVRDYMLWPNNPAQGESVVRPYETAQSAVIRQNLFVEFCPDLHSHVHCSLESLGSVDWSVDVSSPVRQSPTPPPSTVPSLRPSNAQVRGGSAPASDVIQVLNTKLPYRAHLPEIIPFPITPTIPVPPQSVCSVGAFLSGAIIPS
jgi:hypothetical protein